MAEIRRFYEELNRFWTEEIGHVVEALQKRRIDPKDIERWNNFRSSLKQTIESWKVWFFFTLLCISQLIKIPCSESATKRRGR